MSNTSASGGYLSPAQLSPLLPGNQSFAQFIQQLFANLSGLPFQLVRPRWQPNPPKEPDICTNWMAVGLSSVTPDANAYLGTIPQAFAQGSVQLVCNPPVGSQIVLNAITITFVSAVTAINQVLIGTNSTLTANNLAEMLGLSSNPNLEAASYTSYSNVVTITANTPGDVGNSYTLESLSKSIGVSGDTLTGGAINQNTFQRHEDLEVMCSFYGPMAEEYSALVRDNLELSQNRDILTMALMGFVNTGSSMHIPDLINERWRDRIEMSVFFRRQIVRNYPVLNLVSESGTITGQLSSGTSTIPWAVNE